MGAAIMISGRIAVVPGNVQLKGATVVARDLRAGAAMVMAALAANGETEICDISKIERGYEHFVDKILSLGGKIKRIEKPESNV